MHKDINQVPNYENKFLTKGTDKPKKLKYGIAAALAKYPADVQAEMRKRIMTACGGIGKNTLSRWENLEAGHKTTIGAEHIAAIAKITYCKIEDLLPAKSGG